MRVVVAPDKFKGTLSARRAAEALADGVRRTVTGAQIALVPLADGGEGTLDVLAAEAEVDRVVVAGPLGDPVPAPVAFLPGGRAVVETASCIGLGLVSEDRRDALLASSRGLGEAVAAALRRGAEEVLVAIGGTASTDGGTGAARALGWDFLDASGRPLPDGGGGLRRLARIVKGPGLGAGVVGLYDVDHPLVGDRGAARVFAPQKGATPGAVRDLETGLVRLAERIEAELGTEISGVPGAGAGGGVGAGIVAFMGGRLEAGFDVVAAAAGFDEALEGADMVVTGEGRFDGGSLGGKVPVAVARRAASAGIPCVLVAGDIDAGNDELRAAGFTAWAALTEFGAMAAVSHPAGSAASAAARALERARRLSGPGDGTRAY